MLVESASMFRRERLPVLEGSLNELWWSRPWASTADAVRERQWGEGEPAGPEELDGPRLLRGGVEDDEEE
jgi:hypothetical protein